MTIDKTSGRRLALGAAAIALIAGATVVAAEGVAAKTAGGKRAAIHISADNADYKEVVPGVSKATLWGDPDKGAYAAFTKFKPGLRNELHTHSNDIRMVVLKGAYIYEPEGGQTIRVGAGEFMQVPANVRHVSSGDPSEGAVFYEEAAGKFDMKLVNAGKPGANPKPGDTTKPGDTPKPGDTAKPGDMNETPKN